MWNELKKTRKKFNFWINCNSYPSNLNEPVNEFVLYPRGPGTHLPLPRLDKLNPKSNDQLARSIQSWDCWLVSLYSSKKQKLEYKKIRTEILVTGNISRYWLFFILLKLLTLLEYNYFITVTNLGSMKNRWWLLKGKYLSP
jgi:hypothetical protein